MKLGVAGAGGRMGIALVRAIVDSSHQLTAACERSGHAAIGHDAGQWAGLEPVGVTISDDPASLVALSNVVLDFTAPAASLALADQVAAARKGLVLGTTGFTPEEETRIASAAEQASIVRSGNFSLGLNLLLDLVKRAARTLPDFDIEILELHHKHKVDAPSGTALMLGKAAAAGRGLALADATAGERRGHTGPRVKNSIGFQSLRAGSIVGEHLVMLAGEGERLELKHVAENRAIFANGAVAAASWLENRPAGLYSVADILGLAQS